MSIYATNECVSGLMDQLSELTKERDSLKAEVERLKAELKIAESFHRVAIKERDAERLYNEQLKRTTVSTKYHDEIVAEAVKERVAETSRLRGALHDISLCSQNNTSSKDECGRIARAALAAKDAEIERLKKAILLCIEKMTKNGMGEWRETKLLRAALANAAPEQKPEQKTCVWEDRGLEGWWPGCCDEGDGGCSKWEYPAAPEKCPGCGKRVEVKP